MAIKLTEKEEFFCQKFIELGNASAAYRHAYDCKKMKPSTIHRKACELQKKGKVTARLSELREECRALFTLSVQDIIDTLEKVARADHRKLFNEDNSYKNVHEIDERTAAAIASVSTKKVITSDGEVTHVVTNIRLCDRVTATALLARINGMYQDPVQRIKLLEESHESVVERLWREEAEKEARRENPEPAEGTTTPEDKGEVNS